MNNKIKAKLLGLSGQYWLNAEKVITNLYSIKRTGWVDRGVKNPETVGEHTDDLIAIAKNLFKIHGLIEMLIVHDWAESNSLIGDRRTDKNCQKEKRWSKKQKYEAELMAMQLICLTLGQQGVPILKLWLEFEAYQTRRAKIAKQLDKFQTMLKAIEYQKQGYAGIGEEFINCYEKIIRNPTLKKLLAKAKQGL
jgi:putative hydrolases of HD superfamily